MMENWTGAFQTAQIRLIIPSHLPERSRWGTDWIQKLTTSPPRKTVCLGERLKVYILLSLADPSHPQLEHQAHLQASLSIHLEAYLLPRNHQAQSIQHSAVRGSTPAPKIRNSHHPSSALTTHNHPPPTKPLLLFSTTYSHPTFGKTHDDGDLSSLDHNLNQSILESSNLHQGIKFHVEKLGGQWVAVWEVENEIATHLDHSTQLESLSLSSVITYHPTRSETASDPQPLVLSTTTLSDSPRTLHFPPTLIGTVSNEAVEDGIEIDLFDGMGRDLSVPLTIPLVKSCSSISANQTETNHQTTQSNLLRPHPNRFSHSHRNPSVSQALTNNSRSENYLPLFSEERSYSAPALSINTKKSLLDAPSSNQPHPAQELNPGTSPGPWPLNERRVSLSVPIVEPIELRLGTVFPHHQLKHRDLTAPEFNHSEIRFVESQKNLNPMLTLEICHSRNLPDVDEDDDVDFLLESVDIKLEEPGLMPEFNDFLATTIDIKPIVPSQPDHNFPYRICSGDRHQLIYSVQVNHADSPPGHSPYHQSSTSMYHYPPTDFNLPHPTSISNIDCALRYQRSGVWIFDDANGVEGENLPSGIRIDQGHLRASGSSLSTVRHQDMNKLAALQSHRHFGQGESMEAKPGFQSRKEQGSGPVYRLSVSIRGRLISDDKELRGRSTGLISGIWTSLLTSHELTNASALELRRTASTKTNQLGSDSLLIAPTIGKKYELAGICATRGEGMVSGGRGLDERLHCHKKALPQGVVAGSKRHSASNLWTALHEMTDFQSSYSRRVSKFADEGHQNHTWLSPYDLNAGKSHSDHHHKLRPKLAHFIDQVSPLVSPPSPSGPNHSPTHYFLGSSARHAVSSPNAALHSSGSNVAQKTSEGAEPQRNPSEHKLSPGGVGKPRTPEDGWTEAKESGGVWGPEVMVEVKLACTADGAAGPTNRFSLFQPFSIDLLLFHRPLHPPSEPPLLGPFTVRILSLLPLPSSLPASPPIRPIRSQLPALAPADVEVGLICLDESIQLGPLGMGECERGKMRLVGLKPGIFQLQALHITPHGETDISFVFVDPLVVVIQ